MIKASKKIKMEEWINCTNASVKNHGTFKNNKKGTRDHNNGAATTETRLCKEIKVGSTYEKFTNNNEYFLTHN